MNKKVTLRKDGRYMVTLSLSAGRKSVYGSSEEDVLKKAAYLEWLDRPEKPGCRYAFSVVYQRWFLLKCKEVKPQSADRIECTYNKYFRGSDVSYQDMRKLDNLYVVDFFADIINGQSITKKEYARILQIFRGVYDFAVDFLQMKECLNWERIRKNIPRGKFRVPQKKETALGDDVISSFSDTFFNDLGIVNRPCATALLFCNFFMGLRIGELACLEWDLIDFENRVVYIRHTETKHHVRDSYGNRVGRMAYNREDSTKTPEGIRTVPLCDMSVRILEWIREYHERQGYGSRYVAYDGQDVVMVRSLDRTLRKLCAKLQLDEFNSHLLRKTFATRLHYGGMPTKEIARLLGHVDIATTEQNYILYMDNNFENVRMHIMNAYGI